MDRELASCTATRDRMQVRHQVHRLPPRVKGRGLLIVLLGWMDAQDEWRRQQTEAATRYEWYREAMNAESKAREAKLEDVKSR